ncbi:hypothetical protein AAMO2058_001471700 [Amorphochlora amoebiformis]
MSLPLLVLSALPLPHAQKEGGGGLNKLMYPPKLCIVEKLGRLRGGGLSLKSKRRKRRNSAKLREPDHIRQAHERDLKMQREMERRLYPHLFPPPLQNHPARVAAGLDPPEPEPPQWQQHNARLQELYGSLWYPRKNFSLEVVAKPIHVPGERAKWEKEMEEYDVLCRVVHEEFDSVYYGRKRKKIRSQEAFPDIGRIPRRPLELEPPVIQKLRLRSRAEEVFEEEDHTISLSTPKPEPSPMERLLEDEYLLDEPARAEAELREVAEAFG